VTEREKTIELFLFWHTLSHIHFHKLLVQTKKLFVSMALKHKLLLLNKLRMSCF